MDGDQVVLVEAYINTSSGPGVHIKGNKRKDLA